MAVTGKVLGEVLRGKAEIPGLIPGERGKSAYEVAVDNGFEGTEQEWLASLKGDKGDDGDKGDNGDKGEGIPPINPEDKDKVLTANADGTAEWKEPTGGGGGGCAVIVLDSIENAPDDIADGTLIVVPITE